MFYFWIQDGEYFLQATNIEVERLQSFCSRAEADMRSRTLSEEGRTRFRIGFLKEGRVLYGMDVNLLFLKKVGKHLELFFYF